jgi:hypothetical protein
VANRQTTKLALLLRTEKAVVLRIIPQKRGQPQLPRSAIAIELKIERESVWRYPEVQKLRTARKTIAARIVLQIDTR